MKHTKGPWRPYYAKDHWAGKSPAGIETVDGKLILCTFDNHTEEDGANAQLMATAPALLVAAEGALAALLLEGFVEKQQAIDFLKWTIKKAKGEE